MQLFQINAMNVSRDDFKRELEKNGLKYGYIPRLYKKFKQGEMTCFHLMIKDYQFVVVTDDENSYPEIEEETEKKIEEYSLEWLENLFYQSTIVGPISYESLMPQLQMYIRVKKAEQIDEKIKQNKCPYCHDFDGHGPNLFKCDSDYETASIYLEDNTITFDNSDGSRMSGSFKIKLCPMCGRKLEA